MSFSMYGSDKLLLIAADPGTRGIDVQNHRIVKSLS